MYKFFKLNYLLMLFFCGLLASCAHPITINPEAQNISSALSLNDKRDYRVGLYISPKDKDMEVTTLGSGGDNVRYFPYRDIEDDYKLMLSNVFKSVLILKSIEIGNSEVKNKVDFIISPKMITTSGGSGLFTWPPTDFTVDLTNTIKTNNGKIIAQSRVIGEGSANTEERLLDHGISGRRAIEDALCQTQVFLKTVDLTKK